MNVPASNQRALSPARRVAFQVLWRVEQRGAWAADALRTLGSHLKTEDAALATELVYGVLRWQRWLDFLIETLTSRPAARLDPEARLALRIGLYQLAFLDRIPAHAAVFEAVELAKRAGKRAAASLVNAALRAATRTCPRWPPRTELLPTGLPEAERLGLLYSHPTWLVERWLERFGVERTHQLLEADNRPPVLAGALLVPKQARAQLLADGYSLEPGRLLRTAIRLRGGNPLRSRAFRQGSLLIQDEASQAVCWLVGDVTGRTFLDLCAAPGNKTALVLKQRGPAALAIAADRHHHRLRTVRGQMRRVGLPQVHLVRLDATAPLPFARCFDRILVDAPCSGTGTLARNPEIRWKLRPADLPVLARRQKAILEQAAKTLAVGGRLVYATCSLEPEENEQVIEAVLGASPELRLVETAFEELLPVLAPTCPLEAVWDPSGVFRTFPPTTATDGFFAAVLQRGSIR